jgi:hypothetical protein
MSLLEMMSTKLSVDDMTLTTRTVSQRSPMRQHQMFLWASPYRESERHFSCYDLKARRLTRVAEREVR